MRLHLLLIYSLLASSLALATNGDSTLLRSVSSENSSSIQGGDSGQEVGTPLKFKPFIGIGMGNITFYGDIANNHKGNHFTVSRLATELRITHPITSYLDFQFHTIFGKISANERSITNLTRNLNFESRIRAGGIGVSYNFDHILQKRPKRVIEPYVYVGIESFEFLSKTDLYDAHGQYARTSPHSWYLMWYTARWSPHHAARRQR